MRTKAHHRDPSQDRLREVFDYTPDDPMYPLVRKMRGGGRPRSGTPTHKYIIVSVDKQNHTMHRLVWIFHNGAIPEDYEIDHRDRNGKNNAIGNLKLSTRADNRRNRATYGIAGYHGVVRNGTGWAAKFRNESGVHVACGTYKTPLEAAKAYDKALNSYFGPDHTYPTNASEGLIPLEA